MKYMNKIIEGKNQKWRKLYKLVLIIEYLLLNGNKNIINEIARMER